MAVTNAGLSPLRKSTGATSTGHLVFFLLLLRSLLPLNCHRVSYLRCEPDEGPQAVYTIPFKMSYHHIESTMDGSQTTDEDLELLYKHKLEDGEFLRLPTKRQSWWRHVSHGAFEAILLCIIVILTSILFFAEGGRHEVHLPTVVPKC